MEDMKKALVQSVMQNASDVFVVCGFPVSYKISGQILPAGGSVLTHEDSENLVKQIYALASNRSMDILLEKGEDDFSFGVEGAARFRCNAYKQQGSFNAVLRAVYSDLPNWENLGIPKTVMEFADKKKGMILVTGATGSGKSTTLACLIDKINSERKNHIITIEDPIEYIHPRKNSIVSQREVERDTLSYENALRAALRQSPDVILLGEMRDYTTISTALTAAETGQLLLSTLHTIGAGKTVDRIIDVFPADQQPQVRVQLSMVLEGVVSQQLIPAKNGGLVAAFEIMKVNGAIRNLIREGKTHQIDNTIATCSMEGMRTMDSDLINLCKRGLITKENAIAYSPNPEMMKKRFI